MAPSSVISLDDLNGRPLNAVGQKFRPDPEARDHVWNPDNQYVLRREKHNTHDPNAVRVVYCHGQGKELHVAYLSRDHAQVLAPLLDANAMIVIEWVHSSVSGHTQYLAWQDFTSEFEVMEEDMDSGGGCAEDGEGGSR